MGPAATTSELGARRLGGRRWPAPEATVETMPAQCGAVGVRIWRFADRRL